MTVEPGTARIQVEHVDAEIARLQRLWGVVGESADADLVALLGERLAEIDLFDRAQLREVVAVCRRSRNLSEAGRSLFSASRQRRASTNDSDRLRKYLERFGLSWSDLQG